jgi:hypothetical protein
MQYRHAALIIAFASLSLSAPRSYADDPLGLYIGGALGTSNVRVDDSVFGNGQGFDAHRDGWKLLLGMRPISLVGAELDYMDFGTTHFTTQPSSFGTALRGEAHPKAAALFGLLYAPIPVPLLDVYGKVGVARLQTDINATSFCAVPPCVVTAVAPFALSRSNARLAYGAGVQFKFDFFAARVEYERINSSTGDPDLASIGVTWSF